MKILKNIAIAAVAAAAPAAVSAASLAVDNPDNHAYLGVRAAVDVSSAANGGAYYSSKAGFSVGGIYNLPIVANFYFEPGLSLFYDTFGTMHFQSEEIMPTPDTGAITGGTAEPVEPEEVLYKVDGSMRNLGFRVPLKFGYHFDFAEDLKVHVFTGPQVNLSLMARYHQGAYITPSGHRVASHSESIFGTGGFKHVDFQWNFGAGLQYGDYYVAVEGSLGITRMKDAADYLVRDLRRDLFTITLGYNF